MSGVKMADALAALCSERRKLQRQIGSVQRLLTEMEARSNRIQAAIEILEGVQPSQQPLRKMKLQEGTCAAAIMFVLSPEYAAASGASWPEAGVGIAGGMTTSELVARVGWAENTIGATLRRLVQAGLVEKQDNPERATRPGRYLWVAAQEGK